MVDILCILLQLHYASLFQLFKILNPFSSVVWILLALSVLLVGCILGVYVSMHMRLQLESLPGDTENSRTCKLSLAVHHLFHCVGHGLWVLYAALFQQGTFSKEAAFLVRNFHVFLWACSKLEHCR